MSEDDLEERTNNFVHTLAASDANIANISAEKSEQGVRVTLDLLNPDDADLVRDVAEEHNFQQYGDTGEQFETQS